MGAAQKAQTNVAPILRDFHTAMTTCANIACRVVCVYPNLVSFFQGMTKQKAV